MAAWRDRGTWRKRCPYCGAPCRNTTCAAHADLPRLEASRRRAKSLREGRQKVSGFQPTCPRCGDKLHVGATTCPTCTTRGKPLRVIHVPPVDDGDNAA